MVERGARHDHCEDAGARHRAAPRRHELGSPRRGSYGHEVLRIPNRNHRQCDPAGGPEAILCPPRRGPPPDLLGDRPATGRPQLADLLLGPKRTGRRPDPDRRGIAPVGTVVQYSARRSVGPVRAGRVGYFGHACAPTSGTKAHGALSRTSRLPSDLREATTRTLAWGAEPIAATIGSCGLS